MTEHEASILTAYLFADMMNSENRGPKFLWSRFTNQAIAYIAKQYFMAEKEFTHHTRLAIIETASELIHRSGVHD